MKRIAKLAVSISLVFLICNLGVADCSTDNRKACAVELPPKLISGNTCYWLDLYNIEIDAFVARTLEPMYKANFNTCDFKILPEHFSLQSPAQKQLLKQLGFEVQKRKMIWFAYLSECPYGAIRDPKTDCNMPPFVSDDGKVFNDKFSLIYWPTWQKLFKNAFELAKLSKELGITGIKLDLETILNSRISYDDYAWKLFVKEHTDLAVDTPANLRVPLLAKNNLMDVYEKWFKAQIEAIAISYERQMHSINPDLVLGMMPSMDNWFMNAFTKYLATDKVPAVIDSWTMYNGEGFTDAVLKEKSRVLSLNANNIYIPWIRINSYRPSDIVIHAYQAAMATNGYSNWDLYMLNGQPKQDLDLYGLPETFSVSDYFSAYEKVNKIILTDAVKGINTSIGYKPVTPILPPLKLNEVNIPQVVPAGDGTGEPKWFTLSQRQVFYIYAKANENIKFDLHHLAGLARPIALHWAIIRKGSQIIREDKIAPGQQEQINILVPEEGVYALVVSAGDGGQGWYGVRIQNHHMGLAAAMEPLRYNRPLAYIFYIPSYEPYEFWIARTETDASAKANLITLDNQPFLIQLDNAKSLSMKNCRLSLELPKNKQLSMIRIKQPDSMPQGCYIEDIWIGLEGASEPFLFDGEQRRIKSVNNFKR